MRTRAALLWLPSLALVAAAADMAQVAAGTGYVGLMRLALFVLAAYATAGIVAAAAVSSLRRFTTARALDDNGVLGLSMALWALILGGGYLNLVHLPAIDTAVTMISNAVLVACAWALWSLAARLPLAAHVASSMLAASTIAALATAAALVVSLPRGDSSDPRVGAKTNAPSVVVIVVDTLRFDRTGLGGHSGRTPNIDRLAQEGTAYRRAYAQASWTKPSVASLFTSLYPSTHGANLRRDRLSREPPTLPGLFASAGYRTAVFSANPWISPAFGFDRGVEDFVESERETFVRLVVLLRLLRLPDRALPGRPIGMALAHLETVFGLRAPRRSNCERDASLIDSFESWIASEPGSPTFAYIHLMSPHIPYDPPGGPHDFSNADQVALLRSTEPLPAVRLQELLELYERTVSHADLMVGRLLGVIEDRGLSDSTIVVLTSDHGEEFFEHGHWGHGKSLYDELIHVPLIMRGPGIKSGNVEERTVMLIDVAPTLTSLVGIIAPATLAGRDLSAPEDQRLAYAELVREGGVEIYMVYANSRKYVETTTRLGGSVTTELFDLAVDPDEKVNLVDGRAAPWQARLESLRDNARRARVASQLAPEIDADAAERLRALGYLN